MWRGILWSKRRGAAPREKEEEPKMETLADLGRRELQRLAKQHGIKVRRKARTLAHRFNGRI